MTAPADPAGFSTAARVRHVLGRLLGPWGWCLALLGATAAAFPGTAYDWPPGAFDFNAPAPSAAERAELDRRRALASCASGVSVLRAEDAALHPRYGRALELRWAGRPFLTADRVDADYPDATFDRHAAWPAGAFSPAWGWAAWRLWGGEIGSGPNGELPTVFGREFAWKVAMLLIALPWLAGWPLLWSLWRFVAGVRGGWGDPRPAPAWRRATFPFAATFAAIAVASIVLADPGVARPTGGAGVFGFAPLRDPFADAHPWALRLVLTDRPPPAPPWVYLEEVHRPADGDPGTFGNRRWGLRVTNRRGARVRVPGAGAFLTEPDVFAVHLSLWYALLPTALWSGTVLWRTRRRDRAGRMRPA